MRCRSQLVSLLAVALTVMLQPDLQAAGPTGLAANLQHRAEMRGYRVREVRWDPVLQQRWAVLESVAHPERPLFAERTDSELPDAGVTAAAVSAPGVPTEVPNQATNRSSPPKVAELVVRSGDSVVLWSTEQNVRMQMAAVAEGNALVGDRIQLRVTGAGVNGDAGWRVTGVVRGPGSVELER